MKLSRRGFLKLSAAAALSTAFGGIGFALKPAAVDRIAMLKPEWSKQTTTICCYCAVGCGLIVNTALTGTKRAINIEGDPDHPINEGALCAKGAAIFQESTNNPDRLKKVLYRAPYSDKWEVKTWDWAINAIAQRIKKVRDKDFMATNAKGQVVNRLESIAHIGSSKMDNEECWLVTAMCRSLGLVNIDHQARV